MRKHHTKNKGDLGVAKAHCDLVEKGYVVLFPTTEHAAFDLVAYDGFKFVRLQIKYRKAVKGSVQIRLKNWWTDKYGSHGQMIDKEKVEVFCVYCPDTDKCYYFRPQDVRTNFNIRIAAPKNNQSIGINLAENYTRVP